MNIEIKFIVYNKLFSDEWSLKTTYTTQKTFINNLCNFINEKLSTISSLKELNLDKVTIQWIDWLNERRIKTIIKNKEASKLTGKDMMIRTPSANFLQNIVNYFNKITDEKEEWEKDKWDVRNLEKYGINYNKSRTQYYIDFAKINNQKVREETKKYFKQRLLSNNRFSWGRAQQFSYSIPQFLNYIQEIEPEWTDLKNLERYHILKYTEWINQYAK